VKTDH